MRTEAAAVRGALLGILIFAPSIFVIGLLVGAGVPGALGLAAYGSFFGGMGFGAMLGAVINLVRIEEEEAEADERAKAELAASDDGDRSVDTHGEHRLAA